jgi:hypothetical protein
MRIQVLFSERVGGYMFIAWVRVECLSALWYCKTWGNHPHPFEGWNGMWRTKEQSWFRLSNGLCIQIRTRDERASTKRRGSASVWVSEHAKHWLLFIANRRGWSFKHLLASSLIALTCLSRCILGWQAVLGGCCSCVEYMCWYLFLVSNTHSRESNRAHMLTINEYKQLLGDCPFACHVCISVPCLYQRAMFVSACYVCISVPWSTNYNGLCLIRVKQSTNGDVCPNVCVPIFLLFCWQSWTSFFNYRVRMCMSVGTGHTPPPSNPMVIYITGPKFKKWMRAFCVSFVLCFFSFSSIIDVVNKHQHTDT